MEILTTPGMNITVGTWSSKLISDFESYIFEIVVYVTLISALGLTGMVSNLINITVFVQMGVMSDSSNVSLLAMSIADLGGVTTLVMYSSVTLVKSLDIEDLNWDVESVRFITAGWPHVMFSQLTCWITAYIAFERCMCVVFPFKVKTWFTPTRSLIIISCIFLYFLSTYLPIFLSGSWKWKLDPITNMTRLTYVSSQFYQLIAEVSRNINFVISPTISLALVAICSKITATTVASSSKWRQSATTSGKPSIELNKFDNSNEKSVEKKAATNTAAQKERKLIRMITVICTVFIVCNLPGICIIYVRKFFPEIRYRGQYHNCFNLIYGIPFFLEGVNSSVNILVYYRLSTRYREVIRKLFHLM